MGRKVQAGVATSSSVVFLFSQNKVYFWTWEKTVTNKKHCAFCRFSPQLITVIVDRLQHKIFTQTISVTPQKYSNFLNGKVSKFKWFYLLSLTSLNRNREKIYSEKGQSGWHSG